MPVRDSPGHASIVHRAHPRRATPIVLEKLLPRRIVETLRQATGNRSRRLERILRPGSEETQARRHAPEEAIVLSELDAVLGRQETGSLDRPERQKRVRLSYRRNVPAVEHLQGLCDELHVDQTTASEFHMEPSRAFLAELFLHAVSLAAHIREIGREGSRSVYERVEPVCGCPTGTRIPADQPGARQRLPFPRVRPLEIVLLDRVEAGREAATLRSWTEAEIDREHDAGGRDVAKQLRELLHDVIVEHVRLDR